MVFYDFIEIGTSDFDTLCEEANETTVGLSIEPVQCYLDKLPKKPGVQKILAAVSDYVGSINVYGIKEEYINRSPDHDDGLLPYRIRGCNSVHKRHPTALRFILEKGMNPDEVFFCNEVPVYNIPYLIQKYNIEGCKYLKLDTEGHDCVILKHFFETWPLAFALPEKILFESNILSNEEDIYEVTELAKERGYHAVRGYNMYGDDETTLTLNK